MVARNCGGTLPAPGAFTAADQAILASADGMIGKARDAMATQQLHQILQLAWSVVAEANRYFAGEARGASPRPIPPRMGTILYVTAEVIRQVAILAQPFIPRRRQSCWTSSAFRPARVRQARRDRADRAGTKLPPPSPVFPRYVEPEASAAS